MDRPSDSNAEDRMPVTAEEWQEGVNLAAAWRMIHDCMLYGLIQGGPKINAAKCDRILKEGKERGVWPNVNVRDYAVEWIAVYNAELQEKL